MKQFFVLLLVLAFLLAVPSVGATQYGNWNVGSGWQIGPYWNLNQTQPAPLPSGGGGGGGIVYVPVQNGGPLYLITFVTLDSALNRLAGAELLVLDASAPNVTVVNLLTDVNGSLRVMLAQKTYYVTGSYLGVSSAQYSFAVSKNDTYFVHVPYVQSNSLSQFLADYSVYVAIGAAALVSAIIAVAVQVSSKNGRRTPSQKQKSKEWRKVL